MTKITSITKLHDYFQVFNAKFELIIFSWPWKPFNIDSSKVQF